MTMIFKVASATLALAIAFAPAQALVIGDADTTNNIPFGGNGGGYYYQQVYGAASFGGAISIDSISFYNSLAPGGAPRTGSFALYLSTTSLGVADFSSTDGIEYPWIDAGFTLVFEGDAPAIADGKLLFDLTTAFNYDPLQGNLVLTVREFSLSGGNGLQLDVDQSGVTNSRFSNFKPRWNQGLVTGFNEGTAAVPEPASWALMIAGFGLVGGAMRRRVAADATA